MARCNFGVGLQNSDVKDFSSKTNFPAQGLVSTTTHRIGWQNKADNWIKGLEFGGQPELLDEDVDLMKLAQ